MAAGVKTLKTRGQEVKTISRRIIPAGEYDIKLLTDRSDIKVGQGAESLPRVGMMVEALGTEGDSGKNVKFFNDLFTSLKPGKDGVAMPYRGNGAVALARALGEELEDVNPPIVQVKGIEAISAKWLLNWAKNRHGRVVRARVRIEQKRGPDGQPTGEKENRIELFIPGEVQEQPEVETEELETLDEGGEVELEAEGEEVEVEEELEEEVEVEEELPPVRKPAPAKVQTFAKPTGAAKKTATKKK